MAATRYFSRARPQECPHCGSGKVARILWGLPDFSDEVSNQLQAGEITLGGCCVTGSDPAWQCLECDTRVHPERLRRVLEEIDSKLGRHRPADPEGT